MEKFLQDVENNVIQSNISLKIADLKAEKLKFSDFSKFYTRNCNCWCFLRYNFVFIATKAAKKSLCIGFTLAFLTQFSGAYVIFKYCTFTFEALNSFITPAQSSVVVGVILIIGSFLAVCLVDKLGRKVKNSSVFFF